MAKAAPAFQFYPDDFLSGTLTMTCAQVGLYIRALSISWKIGPLPTDQKQLAQALICPPLEFKKLWPVVSQKFTRTEAGYINARLERIRAKQASYRESQSNKALASVAARAKPSLNRASAEPQPSRQPTTQPNGQPGGQPGTNSLYLSSLDPDQEQPSRTQAVHPSGEERSTEDQFDANDGREVYLGTFEVRPRMTAVQVAENPAALTKIAHGVLTDRDNGRIPALDVPGAVKDAAGAAGLAYDSTRVRKALDAAEYRRQRDTPISAALRIAEEVLRQAPGLTLTVPEFHRAIFDRTADEYGDVPDFADAVRTLLYDPRWPKHEPDHFGLTDTLKDPDTGRRLLKPVVGAYHWRQGANT